MKKNVISKIQSIKQRADIRPWSNALSELKETHWVYEKLIETGHTENILLFEYIPVKIVACFQSDLRIKVRELIELGFPYSENIKKISEIRNLRLEFAEILDAHGKQLSIPEIAAHHLSFNSLEAINISISILTGTNFLSTLFSLQSSHRIYDDKSKGQLLKDISDIFKLRHIYCHELNPLIKVTPEVLLRYLKKGIQFLELLNYFFYKLEHSHKQKQGAIKEVTFTELEQYLNNLIKKIIKTHEDEGFEPRVLEEELSLEIEQWKKYRKKTSKQLSELYLFSQNQYKVRYQYFMESLTKEKIRSLEEQYQDTLEINKQYENIEEFK